MKRWKAVSALLLALTWHVANTAAAEDCLASEGCVRRTLVLAGNHQRTYLLYTPSSVSGKGPVPLVVDFHGGLGNALGEYNASCWKDIAKQEGFAVAYPEGIDQTFNAATCCAPANLLGVDDVGFTKLIVNDVKASMQIDPRRVYAVGWSNGGKMAARLACEATTVFAGAGYISQSYAFAPSATCFKESNAKARPVIEFRSTLDPIVPYGTTTPFSYSAADSMTRWAAALYAGNYPVSYQVPVPVEAQAQCKSYPGGRAALAQCSLPTKHDAQHNLYLDPSINVCTTTWEFFKKYPRLDFPPSP
ncbi:MAG TPA: PHB depolymerase family esterase [Polyangiales bacterium]